MKFSRTAARRRVALLASAAAAALVVTTAGSAAAVSTFGSIAGAQGSYLTHEASFSDTTINSQTATIELSLHTSLCNVKINWVYLDSASRPWYTETAYTNTGCLGPYDALTKPVTVWRGKGKGKAGGFACAYIFTNNQQRARACLKM